MSSGAAPKAGWARGPDGVEGVASGDLPWFLHELQERKSPHTSSTSF